MRRGWNCGKGEYLYPVNFQTVSISIRMCFYITCEIKTKTWKKRLKYPHCWKLALLNTKHSLTKKENGKAGSMWGLWTCSPEVEKFCLAFCLLSAVSMPRAWNPLRRLLRTACRDTLVLNLPVSAPCQLRPSILEQANLPVCEHRWGPLSRTLLHPAQTDFSEAVFKGVGSTIVSPVGWPRGVSLPHFCLPPTVGRQEAVVTYFLGIKMPLKTVW